MLVLSRKIGEKIYVGKNIEVMIISTRGSNIQVGITAPRDVPIMREELLSLKERDAREAAK